jgi:hypothetical protein
MQNGHLKMATDKRVLHLRHFFFINTTNRNYRILSKIILRFNYSIVHDFFRILNVEVNFKLNQLSFQVSGANLISCAWQDVLPDEHQVSCLGPGLRTPC